MYDGNPGEIDFGSSSREVWVKEGLSYQESAVFVCICMLWKNKMKWNEMKGIDIDLSKWSWIFILMYWILGSKLTYLFWLTV